MTPESDTELLARARGGSDEALNALFERCGERLLALIRLRLGPGLRARLESRDVLQATLLRAYLGFPRFAGQERGALMAWLARIAQNEIRDQADFHSRGRRDPGREVVLDEAREGALASRARSVTSRIALDQGLARVEAALERLSPEQREVVLLRRLEELSYPDIGERLGRSPDACRMLFARAMAALTVALVEPA